MMNKAEEKTGQVERIEKVEKVEKIEKIEKIEIDGMEEERNLGNDYYDGTGFFNYDDYYDWSNSAIKPQSCYNSDDGPMVVYSLYKDGHNDCKRHKIGTYQVPVSYFLKAHGAQLYKESYYTGVEYKGRDMQDYLNCQATKINDAYFYLKLGCMDHQHGNGFQVLIYKDPYCSTRANVYNNYYDTSSLNVNFNYCKKCDYGYHSQYNSYDGNNDGYNGRLYYYYHNNNKAEQLFPMHASPLCSAMYAYREDCGFRCRRKAATVAKSSHSQIASGDGFFGSIFGSGDEYTGWEIFGISALSLSAIMFLLGAIFFRRKLAKATPMEESMSNVGFGKAAYCRSFTFLGIFTALMILLRKKFLMWIALLVANIIAISYFVNLHRQGMDQMENDYHRSSHQRHERYDREDALVNQSVGIKKIYASKKKKSWFKKKKQDRQVELKTVLR